MSRPPPLAALRLLRPVLLAGGAAALLLTATAAAAQNYRVVAGDVLSVSHVDTMRPEIVPVDLDGRIRVPDLGTFDVAGDTLDEIEDRIDAEIASEGLVLNLEATVSISSYAPVVVMGDVARPGRFDYIPGMSVATALGLSGGSRVAAGLDPVQLERAVAEVSGQAQVNGLRIATAATEIARLEAALGDAPTIELDPGLAATVPAPDRARLDALLATETAVLENDRARLEEQVRFWSDEIEDLEAQGRLLEARIAVQDALIAQAAESLQDALDLQGRGLQTNAALTRAQQTEAEARARALELESLGLSIRRNLSEARRARARFERNRREEALSQLRAARETHQDAIIRHARAIEQQAILQGGNVASLIAADAIRPDFRLLRPRDGDGAGTSTGAGEAGGAPADLESALLPGDTLIVTLGVAVPQDG